MLKTTRDMVLPTAITGSYPRPLWYDASLGGRSFKAALGDSLFREQYFDAVAAIINAQEAAGLDIVTHHHPVPVQQSAETARLRHLFLR
jgi:5-methyltetrahydropteroyltriglutamate--homocysteine methyltransferase